MPETLIVIVRGTVAYFTLLIMARLLGKKQLSQVTFFDYAVGITIGSIAASFTTDLRVQPAVPWAGLLVWTFWSVVLGIITVHSRKASNLIDGEPTVVVHNGEILESNLERMNYTIDDLRMQLRQKNAFKLADVEFALLEPDGNLSVLLKSQFQPVTPSDLGIPTKYKGLAVELIVDGHIVDPNLEQLNLTREWLKDQVRQRNHELEQVYYAELDTEGHLHLDLRHDARNAPVVMDVSEHEKGD